MSDGEAATPKKIGKCRILGRLGHGKTGSIFRAFYEPLQKEVAVKVLKPDAKASAELREKFLNEARSLAKLDHEHIVKVFDVVEESGHLLIIMELLKGRDLYRIVRQDGPIEASRAVDFMIQAARALQAAHRLQIVHRDVKPANLMLVGRKERVKLVDFGLATAGAVTGKAGTPHFMSPEQITGKRVDPKSDVYSLGATFFHILTGAPPYPGMNRQEILDQHLAGRIPAVSRVDRDLDIPRNLDPVVKRMMAPVPGYRYSPRDLITALEGLNLAAPARPRRTHAARAATDRARKPPVALIVCSIVVLIAAAVVGVLALSGGDKKPKKRAKTPVVQPGPEKPTGPGPSLHDIRTQGRKRDPARIRAADNLFKEAETFERQNKGDYDGCIAKYREVEAKFDLTPAAEQALIARMRIEKERDKKRKEAEEESRRGARREAQKILMEELKTLRVTLDFGAAQKKLENFMLSQGESKNLIKLYNRLGYASICLEGMVEEINTRERKFSLRSIRQGASKQAKIIAADAARLTVDEGGTESRPAWSSFTPEEIVRFGGRMPWFRNAKKMFYLSRLCYILGEEDEARNWEQSAEARDEFGEIARMMEEEDGGWK